MMNDNNNKRACFLCYSPNLQKFLENKGLPYLFKGVHNVTKVEFWSYPKSDILNGLLDEYGEGKK